MSRFARRAHTPPQEPCLRAEETWITYYIQHGYAGEQPGWFTTWVGETHLELGPEAEKHELAAHHALDRAYPSSFPQTRLLARCVTLAEEIVVVPAVWEVNAP